MPMPYLPNVSPQALDALLTRATTQALADLQQAGFSCVAGVRSVAELNARGGVGAALVRNHAHLLLAGLPRFTDASTAVARAIEPPPRPALAAGQRPSPRMTRHHGFDARAAAAGELLASNAN